MTEQREGMTELGEGTTELDKLIKAAQVVMDCWNAPVIDDDKEVIETWVMHKHMDSLRQAVEQAKGGEAVAFCPNSRGRDEQIRIALKYWAKDVSFKNKHELIDALLGLCVTDGIGGDGIVLWKPAKDAINGILNTTPPSIDALIAEIDAIPREGEVDYDGIFMMERDDGEYLSFDAVMSAIEKYRGVKQ